MAKIYWKVQQGTAQWFKLRSGIPTASCFNKIITQKRMEAASARRKYACQLIAERLLNYQAESLEQVRHIEEGRMNEPLAVGQLQATYDLVTHKVGFVTSNDGRFGASPDRAIGGNPDVAGGIEDGSLPTVLEVKSPTIVKQFEYLLLDGEEGYRAQVQGQLLVAEADKAIFYSYNPRMPAFLLESGRDEVFIKKLSDSLERFSDELEALTLRAKELGGYEAFAEMLPPVDAERGDGIRRDPLASEEELAAILEQPMRDDEMHRMGA